MHCLYFVLISLSSAWAQDARVTDYGPLPNPKITFDESNYPNLAFSEAEAARRDQDFAKAYTKAYMAEYSKSRGLPGVIPFTMDVALNRTFTLIPEEVIAKGLNASLMFVLDRRVLGLETFGGIKAYRHIERQVQLLEEKGLIQSQRPPETIDEIANRISELIMSAENNLAVDDSQAIAGLEDRVRKLTAKADLLSTIVWSVWAVAGIILVFGFFKRRKTK